MNEQRTPDEQSNENALICEKLLGWQRRKCFSQYDGRFMGHDFLDGKRATTAPSFDTWADAGLILDALIAAGVYASVHHGESGEHWKVVLHWQRYEKMACQFADTGPLAIRAASLQYLRRQP